MKRVKLAFLTAQLLTLCIASGGCSSEAKVEIEMQDGGKIQIVLDRKNAPITVDNL